MKEEYAYIRVKIVKEFPEKGTVRIDCNLWNKDGNNYWGQMNVPKEQVILEQKEGNMAYCNSCGHYVEKEKDIVEKEKDIEVVEGCNHIGFWKHLVIKRQYNEEVIGCCSKCGHVEMKTGKRDC